MEKWSDENRSEWSLTSVSIQQAESFYTLDLHSSALDVISLECISNLKRISVADRVKRSRVKCQRSRLLTATRCSSDWHTMSPDYRE